MSPIKKNLSNLSDLMMETFEEYNNVETKININAY